MKNDRSKTLRDFRLDLNLELIAGEESTLLAFQNQALRPILKFQNELILMLFDDYISNRKIELKFTKHNQLLAKVTDILHRDLQFKALLIGCVISLFDQEELIIYFGSKKELNKRIIAMQIERIFSQRKVEK